MAYAYSQKGSDGEYQVIAPKSIDDILPVESAENGESPTEIAA